MSATRSLLLNGFMGTGKSTVGRRLADKVGAPFVDPDVLVAERAGRPIPDIFAAEGEAGFRARETEALSRVVSAANGAVVALGGGALLQSATRRALLATTCIVTLTASATTLLERTRGDHRPLLGATEGRRGASKNSWKRVATPTPNATQVSPRMDGASTTL